MCVANTTEVKNPLFEIEITPLMQASEALTLKSHTDWLISQKAYRALEALKHEPANSSHHTFTSGVSTQDSARDVSLTRCFYSIQLEKVVPSQYIDLIKSMCIALGSLGIKEEHYPQALQAAASLGFSVPTDFFAEKIADSLNEKFNDIRDKYRTLEDKIRDEEIRKSPGKYPIMRSRFAHENLARGLLKDVEALEFDLNGCPYTLIAERLESVLMELELERRSYVEFQSNPTAKPYDLKEFKAQWETYWKKASFENSKTLAKKVKDNGNLPENFWRSFYLNLSLGELNHVDDLALFLKCYQCLTSFYINCSDTPADEIQRIFSLCINLEDVCLGSVDKSNVQVLSLLPNIRKLKLDYPTLQAGDFVETLPASVVELETHGGTVDVSVLNTLTKGLKLQSLVIDDYCNVEEQVLIEILRRNPGLETLSLRLRSKVDGKFLEHIPPKLQEFELSGSLAQVTGLRNALANISKDCKKLYLGLHSMLDSTPMVDFFGEEAIPSFEKLEEFELYNENPLPNEKFADWLGKMPNLEKLLIGYNSTIDNAFVDNFLKNILPKLPKLSKLTFLDCSLIEERIRSYNAEALEALRKNRV